MLYNLKNTNKMSNIYRAFELLQNKESGKWTCFDSLNLRNTLNKRTINDTLHGVRNDISLLHVACEQGLMDAVEVLIDMGADQEVKDVYGNTPLDLAVKNNYTNLVKLLTKGDTSKLTEKIEELETQVQDHRIETRKSSRECNALRKTVANQKYELSTLRNESRSLKRRRDELENDNVDLMNKNKELTRDNKKLRVERDTFKDRYTKLKEGMRKK